MALKKALVIDPDPELGGLLSERLKDSNIDVIFMDLGTEGFQLARQIRPSIIIHELALPDISGFYLLEKIRTTENTFHIPVIVLTHRVGEALERRAMESGANAFVRKPYHMGPFMTLIRDLAGQTIDRHEAQKTWRLLKPTAAYRLVTQRLEVEIRTDHHIMRGLSSGINENGMGAHVNVLEKTAANVPDLAPGQPCTVYFRSNKYPLMPCSGTVLRLEESWDRRYRQFIAIKFPPFEEGGMTDSDRISLTAWIRDQMD